MELNLNNKYGAFLIFGTDQAESKWQEDDKGYVLSYGKDTNQGRIEIDLITPSSSIGQDLGLEQALVSKFSVWKEPRLGYILGGDQELPNKLIRGKRYYAEFQQPGETRPIHKKELYGVYSALTNELSEEGQQELIGAVKDALGYESPEKLAKSVKQQIKDSYKQAKSQLSRYWSDHLGED